MRNQPLRKSFTVRDPKLARHFWCRATDGGFRVDSWACG